MGKTKYLRLTLLIVLLFFHISWGRKIVNKRRFSLTRILENFTLSPLKSTIINLQGFLSAELGSEFYLATKDLLQEPYLVLLDASNLEGMDEIGAVYLRKFLELGSKNGSRFAVAHLGQRLGSLWDAEDLTSHIPRFPHREAGIQYLESFLRESGTPRTPRSADPPPDSGMSQPSLSGHNPDSRVIQEKEIPRVEEERLATSPLEEASQSQPQPSLVYCPHCDALLRTENFGDHSCPECSGKFYVQTNFHISPYEKLV